MTAVASTNPWPTGTVGECAHPVTSGYTPRGGAANYIPEGPLLFRSQNVQMLRLDLSDCAHLPEPVFAEMARVHIEPEDVLVNITGKGTAGRVACVPRSDLRAAVNQHVCIVRCDTSRLAPAFLTFLLSTPRYQAFFDRAPGSTRSGISHAAIRSLRIPLPPLPVQERIVAILQKADEIWRKRHEALQIADQILPALFIEMFGDPAANSKGWPQEPIGQLVHVDTSQTRPEAGRVYDYLVPDDIEPHTGVHTGPHPTPGEDIGSAKHSFTEQHVLYCKLRPYLNKVVLPETSGICSTELVPLRPGPNLLREFLAIYLRLPFFVSAATVRAQGTKMPRFGPALMRREPMIIPPITLQEAFCARAVQLERFVAQARHSCELAETTFNVLLQRAFTGELTAEWEARNADWIAQRQAFYERLPRLVLLAFLRETAERARRATEASVLITALIKYAFLLQMEGASRRRLYNFVPYHYGPFAQEVYGDLGRLERQGLVAVENDDEKTCLSLTDPDRAEQALQELPDDLRQDVSAIIEAYGDLDHNALLSLVYERYPGYAKKSRRGGKRKK